MTGKTSQRKLLQREVFKEQAGICQEDRVEKDSPSEVCLIFLEHAMARRERKKQKAEARS